MGGSSEDSQGGSVDTKLDNLIALLDRLAPVAIGFSGGVDSTFLAAVCSRHRCGDATLFHLETPFSGTPERDAAARLTRAGADGTFDLPVVSLPFDALADPTITANTADRCYVCKQAGFSIIIKAAQAHGINTVVDGSNADDALDDRPGIRALREAGVRSPLMETGWHKAEERELLRAWGFDMWNMPAGACLATRIPCGESITACKLEQIRSVEDELHARGAHAIRARLVDGTVRIELGAGDAQALGMEDSDDELPIALVRDLEALAKAPVHPIATPYHHGAMAR